MVYVQTWKVNFRSVNFHGVEDPPDQLFILPRVPAILRSIDEEVVAMAGHREGCLCRHDLKYDSDGTKTPDQQRLRGISDCSNFAAGGSNEAGFHPRGLMLNVHRIDPQI